MIKKKIGMIWDSEYPKEIRIQSESERLIKEGFQIIIFCLGVEAKKNGSTEIEDLNGVQIQRYFVHPFLKKIQFLAYTFPLYHFIIKGRVQQFITNNSIDIIHAHNMYAMRAITMLNLPQKFVFDIHENLPECFDMYTHTSSFLGKILVSKTIWKKYEKQFIEKSLKTIVVTKEAAQYYEKSYNLPPEKFIVCPNFVRESFQLNSNTENFTKLKARFSKRFNLLYIGDTAARRGLYTVLESLISLKDIIPEINFIVLGKSKEDHKYKNFIKTHHLEKYTSLEGWVDEQTFADYINNADIGLCPLVRNIHHDTTYANKLFQYMALGLPMVVSDCTSQKNLVEKHEIGLVHKAGDKDEFIACIAELYKNTELRQQYSQKCKEVYSNEFQEDFVVKDLVDFYNNI